MEMLVIEAICNRCAQGWRKLDTRRFEKRARLRKVQHKQQLSACALIACHTGYARFI